MCAVQKKWSTAATDELFMLFMQIEFKLVESSSSVTCSYSLGLDIVQACICELI